jgi:hypothetical protein
MDLNSTEDRPSKHRVREMLMREAHVDSAYRVEPRDLIRAEMCIQ